MKGQTSLFDNSTRSFHNTTDLKEKELINANKRANLQEQKILKFFEASQYNSYTPSEVWLAFGQQWPLTSVRRSITNLTNEGYLIKLKEQRVGFYGEKNYCWKLNLEQ